MTALLVTLPVSPYVELARWTLDRRGVAYTEEAHAPVFHVLATRRHGGTGTVPVLDLGSESLTDARQVVQRFDPLPDAEAEQLFDELFDVLGVAVRAWAYAYMLPHRPATGEPAPPHSVQRGRENRPRNQDKRGRPLRHGLDRAKD